MKASRKRQKTGAGFTIIELLTIMSIIVILMTILVPGMNKVKIYARDLKQRAQFHGISTALELFHSDYDDYPDSGGLDLAGVPYCGAIKLAEAMVGQDMEGFHRDSRFLAERTTGAPASSTTVLYNTEAFPIDDTLLSYNLQSRRRYLQVETSNPNRLWELYGRGNTGPFAEDLWVLSDVYPNIYHQETGDQVGTPILYYKANRSKRNHSTQMAGSSPGQTTNTYDHWDNHELAGLPVPQEGLTHPLFEDLTAPPDPLELGLEHERGYIFYKMTRNKKLEPSLRPMRADSYILWSAGNDGLYGTRDDILNFRED